MSKAIAEAWFEAFRGKDLTLLDQTLAADFVHSSPFGEIKGKETYLDLVRQNPEAFFSPTLTILDVIDDGPKVAVRYLVNDNPACDCIYVRDGRITKIFSYYHYGKKPSL